MRITTLLILVISLHLSAKTTAQKITLASNNISFGQFFKQLKKQTGYSFLLENGVVSKDEKISINVKDAQLETVLDQILTPINLSYKIENKTVYILKSQSPPSSIDSASSVPPTDIHGHITDSTGHPLAGASITVKGTQNGTTTDANGDFVLTNVKDNATLIISYTGYVKQQYKLKGQSSINISLIPFISELDKVQVIAYGTTTQRVYTGDVSVVGAKAIEQQQVNNPLLALEGRVPGLFISQASGLPGSGVSVQIRGNNSISSGSDPFYVIDGVPFPSQLLPNYGNILGSGTLGGITGNPLSFINPSDIESITILKDAVATSIYGSRAGNGAILITTKKGASGQTRVDFNVQQGIGQVPRKLDLMTTPQYLQMRHEAISNDGLTTQPTDYDINGTWDTTRYTDWQKTLIGGTAQYTNIYGSVSGGNSTTQYLFGATYNRQTTVFPGDFSDQKGAINISINSTSINQKFHFHFTGNYLMDDNQLPQNDFTSQAMTLPPDSPPVYNKDGSLNWAPTTPGSSTWQNPLAANYNTYQNKTSNLVSNAIISYTILPGLDLKSSFGYNKLLSNEFIGNPIVAWAPEYRPYVSISSNFGNSSISSWIIEPQVSYDRVIGRGKLDVLLGTTIHQMYSNGLQLQAYGFNNDQLLENIAAASNLVVQSTMNAVYKYNAAFGRLDYNWAEKYILDLSIRRDGSSRFGPANQFHNFGAAGIAWLFSQEGFIKNSLPFLSFGKLRASYGTSGNDQIGDYKFLNLYTSTYAQVPYQGAVGLAPNGLTNPYLEWELTKKLEFGTELGFIKDRILVTASYYQNKSSNELLGYNLPIISGQYSITRNFPATVQNSGWEFILGTVNIKSKDFEWTSHLNISIPSNKLIAFPNLANSTLANFLTIGQPVGEDRLFHFLGVDPATGIYQFADGHGGATSSPDTIANYLTGHSVAVSTLPKFYGGFDNNFRYKGFELDILFQFAKQMGPNNYFGAFMPGVFFTNEPKYVLNRWQKPKDISAYQRYNSDLSLSGPWSDAAYQSDAAYSDASYIRLKNLSLSWQLPETWRTKAHLQNARLYILAQNLLTITSYNGLDPETRSSTSLPPLRVVTFGFQVTF